MPQPIPYAFGRLGWIAFTALPHKFLVCARYAPSPSGRLVVVELHVSGNGEPVTGGLLRELPVARLEAFAQEASSRAALLHALEEAPQARGARGERERRAASTAALLELLEELERSSAHAETRDAAAHVRRSTRPLDRGRVREGDPFYEEVALQYGLRAYASPRPAAELAREAGVPVATVHRWVSEARRRGFLPPGRKGQVG